MKFIADSCSNLIFPEVEGEVSINTATYNGRLLFSSLVNESIFCGTLSSSTRKSFALKPETNCPFLSVTVIGSRTRRMLMTSACEGSGVAVGTGGLGRWFCADPDATTIDKTVIRAPTIQIVLCIFRFRINAQVSFPRLAVRCGADFRQLPFCTETVSGFITYRS